MKKSKKKLLNIFLNLFQHWNSVVVDQFGRYMGWCRWYTGISIDANASCFTSLTCCFTLGGYASKYCRSQRQTDTPFRHRNIYYPIPFFVLLKRNRADQCVCLCVCINAKYFAKQYVIFRKYNINTRIIINTFYILYRVHSSNMYKVETLSSILKQPAVFQLFSFLFCQIKQTKIASPIWNRCLCYRFTFV